MRISIVSQKKYEVQYKKTVLHLKPCHAITVFEGLSLSVLRDILYNKLGRSGY